MLFIVENNKNTKLNILATKLKARQLVLLCTKGATEEMLDKYLIKHYKRPLTLICLDIINNSKYSFDGQGNMIITAKTKYFEKLADIITYGTGKICGSNILRRAFK